MIRCGECGLRLLESLPVCPIHGRVPTVAPSSPPRPSSPSGLAPEPVFQLEGYELRGVLGRGGFGVVYRAERGGDGLNVAVKVASREQRGASERLSAEIDALLAIGEPYVPRVYGHGSYEGQRYVILELVQAATLADHLAKQAGPLPLLRFELFAQAILDVLEFIHARGFVHCDLKPENIFLDDEPRAKFIDFGATRKASIALPTATSVRDEDAGVGTAEYMSPEQCEARSDIGVGADIYSLGVVLYEMLCGSPPFWGNNSDVREAQMSRRPPRLTNKIDIIAELDDVVLRCLAKDPAQRYQSVSALHIALDRALSRAHQANTPPAGPEQGGWEVVQSSARSAATLARRAPLPKPEPSRPAREKRPVGLLFFESPAGVVQVTQALAALGGQLAQASRSQYVGVFGHDVADNPARSALLAGQRLLERKLCARLLLDVAPVAIQVRPDGERRFLSALFSRKERYPLPTDPTGILLTESAAEVLAEVPTRSVPGRAGVLCVDLSDRSSEVTTFGTRGEVLVGRDELVDGIVQQALHALNGLPSVVTVIGEPGYGKSLVASTVAQRLLHKNQKAQVFKLTGQESIGGATHPTLRDLLRLLLALPETAPADYGESLLTERIGAGLGPQVWAAAALVLGWVPSDHPSVRHLSAAPGALRSAAARAAGELLRNTASAHPVLVVLDDAHLADEAALDALEYAALRESGARICVCALSRPGLQRARPTWGNRASFSELLTLGALDREGAALLARKLLAPVEHVPEAALGKLVDRTQGIPRLMVELVRGLRRSGLVRRFPRGTGYYLATDELERLPDLPVVQWSANREIEALPAQLAGHARLAAVFGGRFSVAEFDGVLRMLERDGAFTETQLDAAIGIRRLLDTGLFNRGPHGQIDFRHALLRETLYGQIPDDVRGTIHRAAFEMYRDATNLSEEERLPRLAFHAARSGLRAEAARTYLLLAERAQHRHAYLDAELLYANALENLAEDEHARIGGAAQGRGLMRFRLGRFEDALKDLATARQHAQSLGAVEREVEVLLDAAMVLDWMGDHLQSTELTEAARKLVGPGASELVQVRLHMAIGRAASRAGQFEEAIAQCKDAAVRAERLGDAGYETRVVALLMAGADSGIVGRYDEAYELLGKAMHEAEVRGDIMHVAAALNNRGHMWMGRQDSDNLIRDLQRVRDIARESGVPSLEWHASANLSDVNYCVGAVEQAREHAEDAIKIAERLWGGTWHLFHAQMLRARLAIYTGDQKTARELLEEVRERRAAALSAGQKDAHLLASDELLEEMLDVATREASQQEWAAVRERCKASSAPQELVEVCEMEGLAALRARQYERARNALSDALQTATSSPGLLRNRVSRELAELERSMSVGAG